MLYAIVVFVIHSLMIHKVFFFSSHKQSKKERRQERVSHNEDGELSKVTSYY